MYVVIDQERCAETYQNDEEITKAGINLQYDYEHVDDVFVNEDAGDCEMIIIYLHRDVAKADRLC